MSSATPSVMAIFVIGSPRSGTSLVGEVVGANSKVAQFGEAGVIYGLKYYLARELKNMPSHIPGIYMERARTLFRQVAQEETLRARCSAFVDHTPWNVNCVEDLQQLFDDVRFIHVVRDGRAVCQSMARSHSDGYKWVGPTVSDRARLWKRLVEAGLEAKNYARWYLEVRYEDLVRYPREVVDKTAHFLGIAPEDVMYAPFTCLQSGGTSPRQPAGYFDDTGCVAFRAPPKVTYDAERWSSDDEREFSIAADLNRILGYRL
jgi:hypothetical protein